MSQYSEMMGSFIRTGNYPIEADYIFDTEKDLVNYYNDPIQYTILHEGLLKIVRDDGEGNQALYWVINDSDDLVFKKLISFSDVDDLKVKLDELDNNLSTEIKERKLADQAIWGTADTTEVDDNLNSILKISKAIIDIKNELEEESDKVEEYYDELKKDIQDVVGTTETDIYEYLQTLDYHTLTEISELLNKFFNTIDDSDNQINTLPELQEFLKDFDYSVSLKEILTTLHHTILGDPFPNEQFRTLRGIEDFIETLASSNKNRMDNIQSELDQTQVGIGLSGDGSYNADKETYYLKDATSVMNALKTLDSLINEAINNCNLTVKDTNTVDLQLDKYTSETILQANVKISSESGNGIIPKTDGIYYKLSSTYEDGILTILVNDNIISTHTIGLSTIVKNAYYDSDQEALVFEFELHNGNTQVLRLPVSTLIREWDVDNSNSTKVVELTREEVIGSGADKLSADVRLFVDKYNILVKQGNTLYVKGTTDNLTHHDLNLEVYLDQLENSVNDISTDLTNEITRAKEAEENLSDNLTEEINRATTAEKELENGLTETNNNLTAEIERAKNAEEILTQNLDAEINRSTEIDEELKELIISNSQANTLVGVNSSSVNLDVNKTSENTKLEATVIVSDNAGNVIQSLSSGLYATIDVSYDETKHQISFFNGLETKVLQLNSGTRISNMMYDKTTENLTLYYTTASGQENSISVNLTDLIIDWEVFNNPNSIITLTKSEHKVNGVDVLSAELKLSNIDGQLLQNIDGYLYASNNAENLVFETTTVAEKLRNTASDLDTEIARAKEVEQTLQSDLDGEISRAKNEESLLSDRIDTLSEKLSENTDDDASLTNRVSTLETELSEEVSRAKSVEQDLQNQINVDTTNLDTEVQRATSKESELEEAINNIKDNYKLSVTDSSSINLELDTTSGTNLTASVKLSDKDNNILQDLASGVYATVDLTYDNSANKLIFTDGINTKELQLSVGSVIDKLEYDATTENLILYYTNASNQQSTVSINVSNLIKEWDILNDSNSVITLIKSPHVVNGIDTLSAELKISNKENQGLQNIDGYLFVSNNAKDLVFEDTTVAAKLNSLTSDLASEVSRATDAEKDLSNTLNLEVVRAQAEEKRISDLVEILQSDTSDLSKAISDEVQRAKDAEQTLTNSISEEANRAKLAETALQNNINSLDHKIDDVSEDVDNLQSNIETVVNAKIDTLQDALNNEITRSTSEDSDLKSSIDAVQVGLSSEITRATTQEGVLTDKINDIKSSSESTASLLNDVKDDLSDHIKDYNNPHKVTKDQVGLGNVDNTSDAEKPISLAVLEKINEINLSIAEKADDSDLDDHIRDHNNPHNVTKEQIGLGNVDNTSDLDKPISLATQLALDKKSDVGHTHTMADITDLENLPIIKGFVTVLSELPEDPAGGDKYIMETKVGSGNTRYTLVEFDGSNSTWKQKLLTTGGIACHIDGDVWKLNSSGRERMLDISDYVYFYEKIYDETKDLIEDIDWEENDETNDTNEQIRLKVTYKTKYGDPNESEATNPYKAKAVKYIDIDKARFLSNAYSRPATSEDVNKGYATTVGEPLLILVMTTGDNVTISLKDSLNIYDPVDTASIDMSVSDWTGTASTSYKISADVKIAETKDKTDAVSLHTLNSTEQGLYAELHTTNTNSITLNPAYGTSAQKTLTADLNINNSLNNNSDVLLTIDSSGLSAKLVWGEYD